MIKTRVRVSVSRFSVGAVFRQTPSNSVVRNTGVFKMNYAKIEFLSISGVIFSPASGGFAPRPPPGLCPWSPGPDLSLLFKLHDI